VWSRSGSGSDPVWIRIRYNKRALFPQQQRKNIWIARQKTNQTKNAKIITIWKRTWELLWRNQWVSDEFSVLATRSWRDSCNTNDTQSLFRNEHEKKVIRLISLKGTAVCFLYLLNTCFWFGSALIWLSRIRLLWNWQIRTFFKAVFDSWL